ncbi:MAG: hypothetical protein IIZ80_08300 [Erysipelotrichaceae bacterium]|nr:hypothetical protein [Erysipelotrichaceae bacterium]
MAENKKIENAKKIEDGDLEKVSGGITSEDVKEAGKDINEALMSIANFFEKFGDLIQLIKTATETNTCPICKQRILPQAEQCEPMDFVRHIQAAHANDL